MQSNRVYVVLFLFQILLQGCSQNPAEFTMASLEGMSSVCTDLTVEAVKPKLKWDWIAELDKTKPENYPGFNQVMASPVVGDLNGDRLPEVVFTTFTGGLYGSKGVLRIVDGATGITIKSVGEDEIAPAAATTPLLIDIDRDGKVEIFYTHFSGLSIVALNYDGSKRWIFPLTNFQRTYQGFSAIDSDKNGIAEIIVGSFSITEDSAKQPVKFWLAGTALTVGASYAVNLNASKPDELAYVTLNGVFDATGKSLFSISSGNYAAGDIDGTPGLELVGVSGAFLKVYDGQTGQVKHQTDLSVYADSSVCGATTLGGGPITLGDFDGNANTIEIAMATSSFLAIFNNDGTLYTKYITQDCSSRATGISSFDFNGDGSPEILYGDEEYFRIFELKNSQLRVIWSTINPSATLNEYPLVADIDGNRTSEILVVSNSYNVPAFYRGENELSDKSIAATITGVRAYESTQKDAWMPTRSLWNSFNYNPAFVTDNLQAVSSTPVDTFTAKLFRRNVPMGKIEPKCRLE